VKKAALALCLIVLLAGLAGCGSGKDTSEFVVGEEMFWTTINEMYINMEDYVGRTVRLSGVLQEYEYEGKPYNAVIRMATCCGPDNVPVGFEFTWNGDLPPADTWIEVVGKLVKVTDGGEDYLMIEATSVEETEEGEYNVRQ
jgi:uncharacterized membrane protein YcgQ (UPF0703/DUF1980 family)